MGLLEMITKCKRTAKRQPIVVFVLEAYLVLASFTLMAYNDGKRDTGPEVAYILWGCVLCMLGLLIAGIVLWFYRRREHALIALAFAAYGFLFYWLFLPTLARA